MGLTAIQVSAPLALAVVATLGYLVGRWRRTPLDELARRCRREIRRAQAVAHELEKVAWTARRNLSRYHRNLSQFKQRVSALGRREEQTAWKGLCLEAAEMLTPTLRLATQLAGAYDQIRQQTSYLMTFTEVRTDALTGVANRRGLDESISTQLALVARYHVGFCVALFDIDHFKNINDQQGHLHGDRALRQVATLLDESARETDVVGRYGGEEFLVVIPNTDIEGACLFADRFRVKMQAETGLTISAGVTAALDGDTADSILSRADAALYRAKDAGRNCVFRHTGEQIEPVYEEAPTADAEA